MVVYVRPLLRLIPEEGRMATLGGLEDQGHDLLLHSGEAPRKVDYLGDRPPLGREAGVRKEGGQKNRDGVIPAARTHTCQRLLHAGGEELRPKPAGGEPPYPLHLPGEEGGNPLPHLHQKLGGPSLGKALAEGGHVLLALQTHQTGVEVPEEVRSDHRPPPHEVETRELDLPCLQEGC